MKESIRNKILSGLYLATLVADLALNTVMLNSEMVKLDNEEVSLTESYSVVCQNYKDSKEYRDLFVIKNREGFGQLLRDEVTQQEYLDMLDSYGTEEGIKSFAVELKNEEVIAELENIDSRLVEIDSDRDEGFQDYATKQLMHSVLITAGYLIAYGVGQSKNDKENRDNDADLENV